MCAYFKLNQKRYTKGVDQLPISIVIVIAVLTIFLSFITALKYAVDNTFVRARMIMSAFFVFIVFTLTASFWQYAIVSLPYTIPAAILGIIGGYMLGVRAAQQKLRAQGVAYYTEHIAHVHIAEIKALNWWALINFYSIMGGLLLINLVGLSNVIFRGAEMWAIATCVVGAFLLGTILPYLYHLWTIKVTHHTKSTAREA